MPSEFVPIVFLIICVGAAAAIGWYALTNRLGGEPKRRLWRRRHQTVALPYDGVPGGDPFAGDVPLQTDPNLSVREGPPPSPNLFG